MQYYKFPLSFCLALFLVLIRPLAYCQTLPPKPTTPQVDQVITAASLNYLGFALTQERRIAPQTTVLFGLGAHYSFYSSDSPPPLGTRFIDVVDKVFGRSYSTSQFAPYLVGEVRHYTRLFERSVRGRDTRANSANYFALVGELPFATGDLINVPNLALAYPVGVKYGLRRPLGSPFYVEASVGMFLKISATQRTLQPRLDATFAWHR
jgi:hypothetical protein